MNIDFAAVGGTAWTVAGSMLIACKLWLYEETGHQSNMRLQTELRELALRYSKN
jgi:hypothetical protein